MFVCQFCQQSHHMLPDIDNRLMFPHMARHNLRHAAARNRSRTSSALLVKNGKKKKCVGFTSDSDDEGSLTIQRTADL